MAFVFISIGVACRENTQNVDDIMKQYGKNSKYKPNFQTLRNMYVTEKTKTNDNKYIDINNKIQSIYDQIKNCKSDNDSYYKATQSEIARDKIREIVHENIFSIIDAINKIGSYYS